MRVLPCILTDLQFVSSIIMSLSLIGALAFGSFEASGVSSIVAVWAPGFLKLGGQYIAGVEAAFMPIGRID